LPEAVSISSSFIAESDWICQQQLLRAGFLFLGAAPANKKTLALERENRLLALTSDRSSFSIWGRSPQHDVKPGSNRAGLRKMIDF